MLSSALLGLGVLLVFTGFSAALGFTAIGMLATIAAIAMLLYAGAVWFGPSRQESGGRFIAQREKRRT